MKLLADKAKAENYDIRMDAFKLILLFFAVFSFIASIYCASFGSRDKNMFIIYVISLIFTIIITCVYYATGKFRLCSVLLIGFIEFIIMPIFVRTSQKLGGSYAIWFAAAIIALFYVLGLKDIWWMFLITFYISTYSMTDAYIINPDPELLAKNSQASIHCLGSFVATAIALVGVTIVQERNFRINRETMEKTREIEKKAGAAKSRFLANMSHEIRTPMNSIIGLSELVLKDEMDDVTREGVTTIKDAAYDLLDIIDDVLMFSKLDSENLHLTCIDFRFDTLLKQVLSSISSQAQLKDLKIRLKIDHNIPTVLNGDDITIRQVIMRLIFISLSLTENGRIMLQVSTEKIDEERIKFEISISDTGQGLAKADLDAIYGAYDTYDSKQNSNLKGIGLKFQICRDLLKLMNGTLSVKSIEGVGLESKCTFECKVVDPTPVISLENPDDKKEVLIYITDNRELGVWKDIMEGFLIRPDYVNSYFAFEQAVKKKEYNYIFVPSEIYPSISNIISLYRCEQSTYVVGNHGNLYGDFDKCRIIRHPVSVINVSDVLNDHWKETDYVKHEEDEAYDGSKARILVVDDNLVNLKVAAGIFKNYKIDIDIAKSGEECIRKMKNFKYHMVLMDMVMPDMNGPQTLEVIRSDTDENMLDVPVIALTANTGGNVRDEILAMGFQEYLAKPIKQRYLVKMLLDFLPPGTMKKIVNTPIKEKKDETDLTKKENLLNVTKGLSNIGFNEESYNAILNTYYSEGLRKIENLPKLLEVGDIQLFTTDVHGIKSSSASIGAMTVSEMFKELEMAGKENNTALINQRYDAYVKAFEKILQDVKTYLIDKNSFEYKVESEENNLSDLAEEKLTTEMLNELKDFVDKMNLKECDRIIDDYSKRNFGNEVNEMILKLKKAYEMFDFHEVKAILNNHLAN